MRATPHLSGLLRVDWLVASLGMLCHVASAAAAADRNETGKAAADLPGHGEVIGRAPASGTEKDEGLIRLLPLALRPTEVIAGQAEAAG